MAFNQSVSRIPGIFDGSGRARLSFLIRAPIPTGFKERLEKSLATSGLRLTRQRREVFEAVAQSHDHPTAEEIFQRARARIPEMSFATVYNCLSVLVQCGLVRQVVLDRTPARFCPNMREHCHFLCEKCGTVTDVELAEGPVRLPNGFELRHYDLSLRGLCPACARKSRGLTSRRKSSV